MGNERTSEKGKRDSLVQRLLVEPKFSHAVFGTFGLVGSGHEIQTVQGPSNLPKIIFRTEAPYMTAFGKETSLQEFKARVVAGVSEKGERFFILSFNDRRGDSRPGSHTDYALVIPPDEPREVYDEIRKDPTVLIEVFRSKYKGFDRSQNTLSLDENQQIVEYNTKPKK